MTNNYTSKKTQVYFLAFWVLLMAQSAQAQSRPKYRTLDGTSNNMYYPNYGKAGIPFFRELPAEYGSADPKNAMNGEKRPSPRLISNILCIEPVDIFNARDLSGLTYIWGQFIDHDMTLTPANSTESKPISLPSDEPIFTSPIPFKRSAVHPGTGVTSPREQTNTSTAWLDGSQVYGSDAVRAKWLRTFKDGKLKTSAGNMLPFNTLNCEYDSPLDVNAPKMDDDNYHTKKTFVAGDPRAAEHPGLTSLHTVFMREHNRICARLKKQGYYNDEEIYQKARKEVGALIQAVTYGQWLSALGISLKPYFGYNPKVRPDIMNTFATAAYRWHTMVEDNIIFRDNDCHAAGAVDLPLKEVFFNINYVRKYDVGMPLKGLSLHQQYETNLKVNAGLRNFLFGPGSGLDLVSLNIQRGRDHGLPNYNVARQYYTGTTAKNFKDISTDAVDCANMQALYKNVNDVDLWVGLFAEPLLPGKSVGKTLDAMIRMQFEKLRDGDYYYYMNDPDMFFDRLKFHYTKLGDIIARNSDADNFQDNVFQRKHCTRDGLDLAQFPCNAKPKFEGWAYLGSYGSKGYYKWLGTEGVLNYEDALTEATDVLKGHLPKIMDARQNAFIASKLGGSHAWIDIHRDKNQWIYEDNTKARYTNWQNGQPDNAGGTEDYARMNTDGTWCDVDATTNNALIVEVDCGSAPLALVAQNETLVMEASAQPNRAFIEWVNNTGYKNDYFTLEKMDKGKGVFEALTTINSLSTDNGKNHYSTYDNAPDNGENTYRIKLTYQDGSSIHSEAKTLYFKGLQDVRVFPNPANDALNIDLTSYKNTAVTVYLYNALGQVKGIEKIEKVANTLLEMDISKAQVGTYWIRISAKDKRDVTQSVVISH